MLAPFATLAFLTTLWLVGLVVAAMLSERGGKMGAALMGRSVLATAPAVVEVAVRVSQRSRAARPMRAQPQWRAAA